MPRHKHQLYVLKELGTYKKYDYELVSKSQFFQDVYTEETKEMIKRNMDCEIAEFYLLLRLEVLVMFSA